ncbi:chemotaxis-specific protein-glutamate methyltransferase CheB [bacterium]|nr:chemotaxis-specific protein-glutamate methyltransferase CheB [bacterium]
MIKVLITEDSPVVRGYLEYILNSDPDIEVVGTARDGQEAVRMVSSTKPDVITMDIHMPEMDGFEATRQIMETYPVPIVIVSASWNPEEVDKTFRTMEAGAVAALEKPRGMGHPQSEASVRELLQTVKLMSEVKVVRRSARHRVLQKERAIAFKEEKSIVEPNPDVKLVAIGASTGGPLVLQTILSKLPTNYPVPIVIVQHIAMGFLAGLKDWLCKTTHFPVKIAESRERCEAGKAYLAPDGVQIALDKNMRVVITDNTPEHNLCPSISYFFRSVGDIFGRNAIGVLLTGMGRDGAKELKYLKDNGCITIAQDKETSIIHGMPGEAIKLGGATYILPSNKIAEKLKNLMMKKDEKVAVNQ